MRWLFAHSILCRIEKRIGKSPWSNINRDRLSFNIFLLFSVSSIQYAQRALYLYMENTLNSENSFDTELVPVNIRPT